MSSTHTTDIDFVLGVDNMGVLVLVWECMNCKRKHINKLPSLDKSLFRWGGDEFKCECGTYEFTIRFDVSGYYRDYYGHDIK